MEGIADWLASIGLEEYVQRFAENAMDLSVIRDLTERTSRISAFRSGIAARCCAPSPT